MTYEEFKKLKTGNMCAVIRTGEPCVVLSVDRENDNVQVESRQPCARGRRGWFNYTELGKI